ncbi:MAG: tRNA (adenosine(37)-N6)-threonylcarbamoyltransferase complex transferase subunit TsaD [Actinomycetota bacterium]|nr:tRNA (adenosine(37)-N6)-threonylcarbamoyltransferase complex transferase subunit TsaD [Actinomycetota bacterium]MDA3013668.1 tRNA (adenosine(37)-N6)-threonylcarbamoyltransferase complex transferase subunit TsaD [Actinomycetota bacterium]
MPSDKIILGFETSCDETAVAILKGNDLLVNIISSQVDIHEKFGGVVPEVASRAHAESIRNIFHAALNRANLQISDIDLIATTDGPGLVGSLVVGYNFAKSVAWSIDVPLLTVDHMVGHLAAPLIENTEMKPPFISLLVSGGHTQIVLVEKWGQYTLLGTTIDDAAGEAFDKLSRFCGFGFPGGPAIQNIGKDGDPNKVDLPRPKTKHEYNYSFSGLKTAATNFLNNLDSKDKVTRSDFAASYQEAIVDSLMNNFIKAVKDTGVKNISGGGGVMANQRLREKINTFGKENNLNVYLPTPKLSTDNAAMICIAAQNNLITNELQLDDVRLSSVIK